MMHVLAVDLATESGAAYGRPRQRPAAWPVSFSQWKDAERMAKVIKWAADFLERLPVDLCAIEAPIGGKDAHPVLVGMAACLQGQMALMGVRTVLYTSGAVRHHFLGKALTSAHFPGMSRAKAKIEIKQRVADRCRALGWKVETLDCADALALWDYACAQISKQHQMATVGGLFGGAT